MACDYFIGHRLITYIKDVVNKVLFQMQKNEIRLKWLPAWHQFISRLTDLIVSGYIIEMLLISNLLLDNKQTSFRQSEIRMVSKV